MERTEVNEQGTQLHKLRTLHLFAGCGGGLLADLLLGHRPICAVEINPYCQQVLSKRQTDGILPWFPIFGDVRTFDGKPWRGIADIVAGGFPCTDISTAGKGAGIDGEQSGLWGEMARVVREVRPRFVFVENSPMLTIRGLGRVLGDLAEVGYDAQWGCFYAADVGAPHARERIFIVGRDSNNQGKPALSFNGKVAKLREVDAVSVPLGEWWVDANPNDKRCKGSIGHKVLREPVLQRQSSRVLEGWNLGWPISEPVCIGVDNGVAERVERTRAIGNGQVPVLAATAWRILTEGI